MAEFKALQGILVKVLESFRARYEDPSTLHIDIMRFLGKDIKLALSSTDVYQIIRTRFPLPATCATDADAATLKAQLVQSIGTKFLQYGIMNDMNDAGSKSGNSRTRLMFREMGTYRFSTGGFGTVFDVCCATWNVGEKKPPTPQELRSMVKPGADIYAIGLQECPAKNIKAWVTALQHAIGAAGLTNMMDHEESSGKQPSKMAEVVEEEEEEEEEEEDHSGTEDSHENKEEWTAPSPTHTKKEALLAKAKTATDMVKRRLKILYRTVHIESMWGIHLIIIARSTINRNIMEVEGVHEATGIGGVMGNKGGCAVVLKVFGTTRLGFFTSHLAARMKRLKKRAKNFAEIISGVTSAIQSKEGLDCILSCDHVFWFGDLNYRINCGNYGTVEEFNSVVEHSQLGTDASLDYLIKHDQLLIERNAGRVFSRFQEGEINFKPTYRMIKGKDEYSNKRNQNPSYCDRILWNTLHDEDIELIQYKGIHELMHSDHRPVSAMFRVKSKPPYLGPAPKTLEMCINDGDITIALLDLTYEYETGDGDDFNDNELEEFMENEDDSRGVRGSTLMLDREDGEDDAAWDSRAGAPNSHSSSPSLSSSPNSVSTARLSSMSTAQPRRSFKSASARAKPREVLRKRGHRNSVINPDLSIFAQQFRVRGWLEKKKQGGMFKRGYQKR